MSRFWTLLRLIPRTMLLFASASCDVVAEPIYSLDGDGGSDAGTMLTSRILVADGAGLIGFDFLGQAPPFANAVRWDDVSAAVIDSDVLFLARPGVAAIAIYDDANRLDPDRLPTRELTEVELAGAFGTIDEMRVDSNGTLWVHLMGGDVRAFFRATMRLPDGSFSAAVFRDGELDGFAYDPSSDRLFAGPGDAGQVLVWVDALTRESVGPSSFALGGNCRVTAMALSARLYAACADGSIAVWNEPGTLSAGAMPDRALRSAGNVRDLQADDALIATGDSGVDIWRNAVTGGETPDVHLDVPGTRALRDDAGTLFVLNTTDVRVVTNAATTPEVVGSVRSERSPLDIAQY